MRKLKTYLPLSYWQLVVAVHGPKGIPREIARIVTPSKSKKDWSALTDRVSVEFTDRAESPDDALRLASEMGPDVTAELRVPLAALRRQHLGIAITDRVGNPFTVAEYLSSQSTTYVGSEVQRFFGSWHPATLADFVGVVLTQDEAASPLARPLISGLLPWEPYVAWEDLVRERNAYELERLARFGPAPKGGHGYDYFGPTSDALGAHRYNKHCRVAQSIVENGFDEHNRVIDVQLLQGDGDWALVVRDGKHRTTALAVLGVEDLVVSLPGIYPVVRRAEVKNWPGVANGLYRADQAMKVFDRFVAGRAPFPSSM